VYQIARLRFAPLKFLKRNQEKNRKKKEKKKAKLSGQWSGLVKVFG